MARFADEETPPAATQEVKPEVGQPQCCQPVAQTVSQMTPQTIPQQPNAKPVVKGICPRCEKKLEDLHYKRCLVEVGKASTDGFSHMLDYESENEKNEILVFSCPHCKTLLFVEEGDAIDFLEEPE
jgi:hypothetical protein